MFDYPVAGASVSATGPTGKGDMMLKEYNVVINGVATTVQLDEASARRMGVWVEPTTVEAKSAPAAKNKARKPRNKSGDGA